MTEATLLTDKNNTTNLVRWLGFPTNFDYRKWPKLGVITGCALGFTFSAALFISAIQFFSAAFGASNSPTIHADARNYALILAALLSIPFVIWRVLIAQKQADIAEQGLITDRINKAVEQLGAEKTIWVDGDQQSVPNLEVRLGAIYALERIAQDSLRDHIPVMEILCAYVRHNASAKKAGNYEQVKDDNGDFGGFWLEVLRRIDTSRLDIQTILTVIGRRGPKRVDYEINSKTNSIGRAYKLDLRRCNLRRLDLSNLELRNADLRYSLLDSADVSDTNLQKATLRETSFEEAFLQGADLTDANLIAVKWNKANLLDVFGMKSEDIQRAKNDGAILD